MPTDQHAEQPEEHEPPPSGRRDQRSPAAGDDAKDSCDCGGCREFRAIHAGFCAELPLPERIAKRASDRAAQRRYDESDGHQPARLAA